MSSAVTGSSASPAVAHRRAAPRTRRRAWFLVALVLLLALLTTAMFISNPPTAIPPRSGLPWSTGFTSLLFAGAGLILVLNRSRNPIGWMLLLPGVDMKARGVVEEYTIR
ncbi:MAG: hypothetical protein FJ314_02760 [SAR202 cluster bacterium]|nr:hypothetical protein [SAR202 cluster bacterium]